MLKWRYNKNSRIWKAETDIGTFYEIEDFNFTDAYKANCEEDYAADVARLAI